MNTQMEDPIFGPIISAYSRAQALEDGILVDVSEIAREAGITFPVALTRTAWAAYVEVPQGAQAQDEQGRLWDVVFMLRCAIRTAPVGAETVFYRLQVVTRGVGDKRGRLGPRLVTLKSVCGPGDDAEPVITIMLPEED